MAESDDPTDGVEMPRGTNGDGVAAPIGRTLDLLFAIVGSDTPLSATDVAASMHVPRPTVYRYLRSLVDYGLIAKVQGGYQVTPGFLRLSTPAVDAVKLADFAEPFMAEMVDATAESCGLHVRLGRRRRCISEIEGTQQLRWVLGVGFTADVRVGAAGIALLAAADDHELHDLEADGPYPSAGELHLLDRVAQMRARGWYLSAGEAIPDAASVAVPIFAGERVVAAMNLAVPLSRAGTLMDHVDRLLDQAKRVSDGWSAACGLR